MDYSVLQCLQMLDKQQLSRIDKIGAAMLDAVADMNVTRDEAELVCITLLEAAKRTKWTT